MPPASIVKTCNSVCIAAGIMFNIVSAPKYNCVHHTVSFIEYILQFQGFLCRPCM